MSFSIDNNQQDRIVVTTYFGTVTDDELLENAIKRLFPRSQLKKTRVFNSDYSDVTSIEITLEGAIQNTEMALAASKYSRDIMLMAIIPKDIEFGTARMWQGYASDKTTGWKTHVVRTRDDALRWVKEHRSEIV